MRLPLALHPGLLPTAVTSLFLLASSCMSLNACRSKRKPSQASFEVEADDSQHFPAPAAPADFSHLPCTSLCFRVTDFQPAQASLLISPAPALPPHSSQTLQQQPLCCHRPSPHSARLRSPCKGLLEKEQYLRVIACLQT